MTIQKFQQLLKKIDPKLRIRIKGQGDVAGLFKGLSGKSGYICRMSKGEFHLNGYRLYFKDRDGKLTSRIQKRGRKTLINLLRNYRWITKFKQRTMLTYGVDYPDSEIRGLTGKDQYGPRT